MGPQAVAPDVPDAELDRSLMGLQLLAEEATAEAVARASSMPPAAAPGTSAASESSREWLWYAVAFGILALGVFGYFWK